MLNRRPAFLVMLLLLAFSLTACDSGGANEADGNGDNSEIDISSTASIAGSYQLVSMTDMTGETFGAINRTVAAGEPTSVSFTDEDGTINATIEVDGTFVFTTTTYNVNLSFAMTVEGFGSLSESTVDSGTYTLSGGQMRISSNDPDPDVSDSETFSLSAVGSQLTMTNNEASFVLQKQ